MNPETPRSQSPPDWATERPVLPVPASWSSPAPAPRAATPATSALVPGSAGAPDPFAILRAFRRRLGLALGLGMLAAALVGPIAWFVVPRAAYTAAAVLRVAARAPRIIGNEANSGEDYRRYQLTQKGLVRSRLVINKALDTLGEAPLMTFKGVVDRAEWLSQRLQVEFTDGSELMRIALSGDHPEELAAIVNAVQNAYRIESVDSERGATETRRDTLRSIKEDRQKFLAEYREKLYQLAKTVGSDDRETIALKQRLSEELRSEAERERREIRSSLRRLEAEKTVLEQAVAAAAPKSPSGPTEAQIDAEIDRDPNVAAAAREFAEARTRLKQAEPQVTSVARQPRREPLLARLRTEYERAAAALAQARAAARPEAIARLRVNPPEGPTNDLAKLQYQIARLHEEDRILEEELSRIGTSSRELNDNTLEMERIREEIAASSDTLQRVSREYENLVVDLHAGSRISEVEAAVVPTERDNRKRYMMILGATLGSFFGCIGLITLLEYRTRKIATAEEVAQGLGMQLVGALPPIPSRLRRRGSRSDAIEDSDAFWHAQMLESIDSTRTVLLHAAKSGNLQLLMVTSAVGGEGKTSLSSHLATSLARSGRRTLLIDGDLRSPSICGLFDLAPTPGFSELLRGEATLDGAIVPSRLSGLSLLPAGHADAQAIAGLARGDAAQIFAELRRRFDFVILDTSPILPVSDALVMAPLADAVVFSILRDVSRLPKVLAAYQRLGSLGVRILGAVVAGIEGGLYGVDRAYPYPRNYANRPATGPGPRGEDDSPGRAS